jgi:predicted RNase H-like nuclease (RuvC/YqgF family)
VGGKRRDLAAEQAAINAASERLLAGTPLRSATGKLTVSGLITESGLRRDIVYGYPHLIDAFKARAKARDSAPAALTALAGERDNLRSQLTAVKDELSRERRTASALRKLIAELSLELDQAREELKADSNVTHLRTARDRESRDLRREVPARPHPGADPA